MNKPRAVNCVCVSTSLNSFLYHVQYFSEASERGYVFEKCMVPFRDGQQYQELTLEQPPQPDRKKVPAISNSVFTTPSV